MSKALLSLLLCVAGSGTAAFAQKGGGSDTTELTNITVFKPTDAFRIPTKPKPETPQVKKPVFQYAILPQPFAVQPEIKIPDAQKMEKEKPKNLKGNYIKLGYGNYNTPLAQIYLNNTVSKDYLYGLKYRHFSANGPGFADFSENTANVFGKRFFKKSTMEAAIGYDRNKVHFYGYDPERLQPSSKDTLAQVYQTYDARFSFESKKTGRKSDYYRFDASFYNIGDSYNQKENNLVVGGIYKFRPLTKDYLAIQANIDYQNYSSDSLLTKRTFFHLNPVYEMEGALWKLNAGFNSSFVFSPDNKTQVYFFPKVEGSYVIEHDNLTAIAGVSGNVKKNSLRNFSGENPFLMSTLNLTNTVNRLDVYAGLKGKLSGKTGFIARIIYQRIQDMAFYIADSSAERRFFPVYDDAKLIRVNVEINHQWSEKFRLALAANYNKYSTATLENPWQVPNMDIKLNSTYNMSDKILLSMDVFVLGARKSRVAYTTNITDLKPLVDANLGIEYRYRKNISAFVKLQNLGGRRYQQWHQYPAYGFWAMGGITFSL